MAETKVYMVELDYDCAEEVMDYLDKKGYGEYVVIVDDDLLQVTITPDDIELDEILDSIEDGGYDYSVDIEEEVYEEIDEEDEESLDAVEEEVE